MAKETDGGIWVNVNSNDEKGHVNIYGSDPKEPHDESIHINIDYDKEKFSINEKSKGIKTSTDGKWFLTTACMKAMLDNFDDKCEELTILRWFRDNFVSENDKKYYYKIAPIIVKIINEKENQKELYKIIYEEIIIVCINAIKNEKYDIAYNTYKNSLLFLQENIVKPKQEEKLLKTLHKIIEINNSI